MDPQTTYAWILLAVPTAGAPIETVRSRAEMLNKASPSERELHDSIAWLREHGFLDASEGGVRYTVAGEQLIAEEWTNDSMYETWSRVARRLARVR